ncbi:MAG TPA: hypothetical protein VLX28_23120 [Thermoanaerobaculia bacterium]|nr:hypothetical protein [Thermoanaerobaculia bacterium]
MLFWTVWRPAQILDSGYALRRSDLGTDRDDTAELIRRAIAIRGEGDRLRAQTLLETAYRTDHGSPIAAALRWRSPTTGTRPRSGPARPSAACRRTRRLISGCSGTTPASRG